MGDKRKIDPELFNTFVDDTLDEISVVENQLIKLEKSPDNHELINSILRPIHSAKGNCSFFGLENGKKLAHVAEDVLNCALKNKNVITNELISTFMQCIDLIHKILSNVRDGGEELDNIAAKYNEVFAVLEETRDKSLDQSFRPEHILEKLSAIQSELNGVSEKHAQDLTDVISEISKFKQPDSNGTKSPRDIVLEAVQDVRNIITASNESALSKEDSDNVGQLLNTILDNSENTAAEPIVKEALEQYKNITEAVGFEPFLSEIIEEQFVKLQDVIEEISDKASEKDDNPEDGYDFSSLDRFELTQDEINDLLLKRYKSQEDDSEDTEEAHESSRNMRVSETSIDHFLESVGKLIVVREMYNNLHRKSVSGSMNDEEMQKQLKRINDTFYQISEKLNDSVMEIRKVPVSGLMQKVPRIVRDVANDGDKLIQVQLIGEDTLIDKRLLQSLDGPMIHIIRNAADHGIESPETRKSMGKPEEGRITVEFALNAESVIVTVSDDGRGLDFDAILQKAISMDLVQPGIELSDKEKENLIFLPGLTTSSKVTEISGRGVGMDVVKKNIEDAGGKIFIESAVSRGTTFTIKLPQAVMTQIITGYVVRVGENLYILPMESVNEIFRITTSQINSVTGKGMCVKRRNQLFSVIRPFEPFEYQYSLDQQISVVLLHSGKETVALHVDEAIGVQRVVLNKVNGLNVRSNIFTASAIMGDGAISMVIDPKFIWDSKVN